MYNGHPWDSKKLPLFKVVVIQRPDIDSLTINVFAGLAIVDMWSLFRGGRKHRFDFLTIALQVFSPNAKDNYVCSQ